MDDQTPTPDDLSGADRPVDSARVPDPHRTEPVPPQQEGTRPGTDAVVRPEQDEEVGPLEGLLTGAAAEVSGEASDIAGTSNDPGSEALLAKMGVEDEGIEGGQLLGLVFATIVSVGLLAATVIYALYAPYRADVGARMEGESRYDEIEVLEAEAQAKLRQYSRSNDTYGVPISRAMGLVVAEYGSPVNPDLPDTRQEWNLLPTYQAGPGSAVQSTPDLGEVPEIDPAIDRTTVTTGEEVGSDVDTPEVEIIDEVDDDDAIE